MKIICIGGGNMGQALLSAILKNKLAIPDDITVSDTLEARRKSLKEKFQVNTVSDNFDTRKADVILLAVKPQTLPRVMTDLKNKLEARQLVISIIAGAKIATLKAGLNHPNIVRSMPNTSAQIGECMTVWTTAPEVTIDQKHRALEILGAMGQQIYVNEEKYIDMATAVSGSGPAYLFYFIESFIAAAIGIGFSKEIAKDLVVSTVSGAVHLLQQSGQEVTELRHAVTSPGGTTAEALKVFEGSDFRDLFLKAVCAAYGKAQSLGK